MVMGMFTWSQGRGGVEREDVGPVRLEIMPTGSGFKAVVNIIAPQLWDGPFPDVRDARREAIRLARGNLAHMITHLQEADRILAAAQPAPAKDDAEPGPRSERSGAPEAPARPLTLRDLLEEAADGVRILAVDFERQAAASLLKRLDLIEPHPHPIPIAGAGAKVWRITKSGERLLLAIGVAEVPSPLRDHLFVLAGIRECKHCPCPRWIHSDGKGHCTNICPCNHFAKAAAYALSAAQQRRLVAHRDGRAGGGRSATVIDPFLGQHRFIREGRIAQGGWAMLELQILRDQAVA